ncbi:MAG: glycosyltransferase [Chitinophagaceae bacterium]|nr:glycosyltransferase [Chitinophagaceae bacterium]
MVSVLIPCYNYGHLIADTLQAISRQTYTGWEVIIVDDGSTDNTALVVQPFIEKDSRISYYRQANAGPSEARKKAIGYAKGSLYSSPDADYQFRRQKVRDITALLAGPKRMVYGSVRYFRDNPHDKTKWTYTYWGKNKEWMPGISGKGPAFLPLALKGSFGPVNSCLFRRSVFEKVGNWNTSLRAAEDYLFVLKCVLAGSYFLYHEEPGSYALVRIHGNNTSRDAKWVHEQEIKMRLEIAAEIESAGNIEAIETNRNAIKALSLMTKKLAE